MLQQLHASRLVTPVLVRMLPLVFLLLSLMYAATGCTGCRGGGRGGGASCPATVWQPQHQQEGAHVLRNALCLLLVELAHGVGLSRQCWLMPVWHPRPLRIMCAYHNMSCNCCCHMLCHAVMRCVRHTTHLTPSQHKQAAPPAKAEKPAAEEQEKPPARGLFSFGSAKKVSGAWVQILCACCFLLATERLPDGLMMVATSCSVLSVLCLYWVVGGASTV